MAILLKKNLMLTVIDMPTRFTENLIPRNIEANEIEA